MTDEIIERLAKAAVKNTPDEVSVEDWGGSSKVNCYAFAANCKQPHSAKANPGEASNYDPTQDGKFTSARLVEGAKQDGMIDRGTHQTSPPSPNDGHYLTALYISADGTDHHWYRKDPNYGRWLHKPGPQGIRNYGLGFETLPTELVMITHNYGTESTNYRFVRFFEVPNAGITVGKAATG